MHSISVVHKFKQVYIIKQKNKKENQEAFCSFRIKMCKKKYTPHELIWCFNLLIKQDIVDFICATILIKTP